MERFWFREFKRKSNPRDSVPRGLKFFAPGVAHLRLPPPLLAGIFLPCGLYYYARYVASGITVGMIEGPRKTDGSPRLIDLRRSTLMNFLRRRAASSLAPTMLRLVNSTQNWHIDSFRLSFPLSNAERHGQVARDLSFWGEVSFAKESGNRVALLGNKFEVSPRRPGKRAKRMKIRAGARKFRHNSRADLPPPPRWKVPRGIFVKRENCWKQEHNSPAIIPRRWETFLLTLLRWKTKLKICCDANGVL